MDTGQIIKQTTNEWLLTRLKAEKTLLAQTNGRATFNTWLGEGAELRSNVCHIPTAS